jgi:hypothetical protein
LVLKRSELTEQLRSLTERRRELQSQREQMGGTAGRDHDARIAVIDQRSAQLESELFATNDMINHGFTTPAPVVAGPEFTTSDPQDHLVGMAERAAEDAVYGAFATSVTTLLAMFIAWRGIRRFILKPKPVAAIPDNSNQLSQLQQSMDAIAIEVERISEAQRYTARMINERAIAAGEAQPVGAPKRESAGTPRRL